MNHWTRIKSCQSLPLGKDGKRITSSSEHIALAREAACEGSVLLKNNSCLPLSGSIAVFGKGIADYVKGGGGSGDVYCSFSHSVLDGLSEKEREGKVKLFKPLADYYDEYVKERYSEGDVPGLLSEPDFPEIIASDARKHDCKALIAISRFSGENWDRASEGSPVFSTEEGTLALLKRESELFENGDFYLSRKEKEMVEKVLSIFGSAIVVLNSGGMIDVSWIKNDERITGAVQIFQGGMTGGDAAADILVGDVAPSGRLTDTYALSLSDYPSTETFHESLDYVEYTDDIYVGYRYFWTIPEADKKIVYPFGYGLSYTNFELNCIEAVCDDKNIRATIKVRNVGAAISSKDVVELYVDLPSGKLDKPRRVLKAFRKTRLLKPGESEEIKFCIPVSSFAEYDDEGVICEAAWVVEKGKYEIQITDDSISFLNILSFAVDKDRICSVPSHKLRPSSLSKRLKGNGTYSDVKCCNSKKLESIYPRFKTGEEYILPGERQHNRLSFEEQEKMISFEKVLDGTISIDDFVSSLSLDILADITGGQPNRGCANTFGFGNQPEYRIPSAMTCDGPAGLRILPEYGINTTAWPCATAIASSWNVDLAESVGKAMGMEAKENGMALYLAPAVNIHRSPLCGRNFEYYSEDPFIAGKIGAATVKGIQSTGVGACVKHFAMNNKETNRKSSDSRVSERAAREIYLKQFEIIIKESDPAAVMSSYNLVNGIQASENRELLTDILRNEWGFKGFVTTDWWTLGEQYLEIDAGNDLKMGTGFPERVVEAVEKGVLSYETLKSSVKRILSAFLRLS